MKLLRLFFFLAAGFIVSSLLTFFFGSGGIIEYLRLQRYRASLQANLDDLQGVHSRLLQELDALGTDPQRITLQARELGYFRPGERVVRIEGAVPPESYYTVGRLLRRSTPKNPWDRVFRIVGLALPAALYVASFLVRRGERARARSA
jgi:cell division protein FtsB